MLRSKYRKRRNKKGGRSFMEAFAQGSGDLKNYASKAGEGIKTGVQKTRQGFNDFENARQGAISKTGMDAGYNPFKKRDPFERSLKKFTPGQSETLNPLNIGNMRRENQRKMGGAPFWIQEQKFGAWASHTPPGGAGRDRHGTARTTTHKAHDAQSVRDRPN